MISWIVVIGFNKIFFTLFSESFSEITSKLISLCSGRFFSLIELFKYNCGNGRAFFFQTWNMWSVCCYVRVVVIVGHLIHVDPTCCFKQIRFGRTKNWMLVINWTQLSHFICFTIYNDYFTAIQKCTLRACSIGVDHVLTIIDKLDWYFWFDTLLIFTLV